MSWVGFTDDELRRLKREQHGDEDDDNKEPYLPTKKRAGLNAAAGKRQRPREKLRTRNTGNAKAASRGDGEEMRRNMSNLQTAVHSCVEDKDNSSPECEKGEPSGQRESKSSPKQKPSSAVNGKPEESSQEIKDHSGSSEINSLEAEVTVYIDEPERIKAMELSAIQSMQQKQKEMEEDNKKKTAALRETIKQRYKKTQAETQTLTMVQRELGHLDNLLSADVRILRDQIDQACHDYLYAQKRYEKAETEFIAAKLSRHHKTERKDLLTKHLCTIIQANEQRKAKKLEALMATLNLSQDSMEMHEDGTEIQGCRDPDLSQPGNSSNNSDEAVAENKPQDSSKGDNTMPCDAGNTSVHLVTMQSESADIGISNKESNDTLTTVPPQSASDHQN